MWCISRVIRRTSVNKNPACNHRKRGIDPYRQPKRDAAIESYRSEEKSGLVVVSSRFERKTILGLAMYSRRICCNQTLPESIMNIK